MLAVTLTAFNSAGASPPSSVLTLTANVEGPAAAPLTLTVYSGLTTTVLGRTAIGLNFSASSPMSLVLYRRPGLISNSGGSGPLHITQAAGGALSPFYLATLPGTMTGFTDRSVTALQSYSYAVTAVNADG